MTYPLGDFVSLTPLSVATNDYAFAASGVECVQDDYIVVFLSNGATTGTISEKTTSAWTLTTLNVASGGRMAIAYLKVGASAPSDVTFTANIGVWQAAYAVFRDADATTFNAGTITTTDSGNVPSASAPAVSPGLTPSSDDALVVYFAAFRASGAVASMRFLPSDVVAEITQDNNDNSTFQSMIVGTVQQTTATATSKTFYNGGTARTGSIVLAIKNKTNGKIARHGIGGATKVAWVGNFGIHDTNVTWGLPDNATDTPTSWDGSGAINGITVSNNIITKDDAVVGPGLWGFFSSISSNLNTAGAWVGRKASFSAAIDMTAALFTVEIYMTAVSNIQFGAEGIILAFRDSTGKWAAFRLGAKLGWVPNTLYVPTIDLENATPYAESTGIAWNDIVSVTPLMHRAGSSATSRAFAIRNLQLLKKSTLIGGNSVRPLDITYLSKVLNGWGYAGLCTRLGPAVEIKADVQIGDGSTPTYFDSSATMLSCPSAYSATTQRDVNVPANEIDITIKASTSDTIYDRASAVSAGLQQNYTIDAASSTPAAYSFAGKTFVGVLPTFLTGWNISSATFSGCGPVAFKGASPTDVTIIDTTATSTQAAATWDANGATATRCTIDGTGAGYALELGASVTAITLTDCTLTAGTTDKVHVKATTGTVTITISGTTSLIDDDVTNDGATVVIAAPQPTLSTTVLANSRVVLYNNTTTAELDNTAPAGTSWSKVITSGASANDSLTLHVFKEGYQEFSTTFLYTGDDATILVTQAADANLTSLRSELGITDYTTITEFILDVTGTVEIDADDSDGASQKARLAIWYNGILTTENGARYLRGAISILSTAAFRINVDVLDLQMTNISGTYGLQFTDTERRLYRSDGTPVYSATSAPGSIQNDYSGVPDTVETGVSGLTGSESAQLMGLPSANTTATAVLSAAQTTPIHADIRKVLGGAIDGTGSDADPWGPV